MRPQKVTSHNQMFPFYAQRQAVGDLLNPPPLYDCHASSRPRHSVFPNPIFNPKFDCIPKFYLKSYSIFKNTLNLRRPSRSWGKTLFSPSPYLETITLLQKDSSPSQPLQATTQKSPISINNSSDPQTSFTFQLCHLTLLDQACLLFIVHVTFSKTLMVKKLSCLN